ncbi:MAG: sigma-54 interaction domain-containing protein [bacterium]
MDKNEFFREVSLRICGNLKIEEALKACLHFLQQVMPVDRMFLQQFDFNFRAMRTIATATFSECSEVDLLTPLSEDAQKSAGMKDISAHQDVFIFDDPHKYAISREMLQFHNVSCNSLMVMLIKSKGQILGSLVTISERDEKFSAHHAMYLELLKETFAIAMSNTLKHRELQKLKDLLADDNRYLHGELRRLSGDEIIGAHFGLKEVMYKAQQVAALDSPILLLGETGVGKDVIANAIHNSSSRSDGPFVSVNCGAIPDTLFDSELFGHEKGAFTGALAQKRGRFERANKGTIFLDEIGELPLQVQVHLLRVLQSKEIERVGGVNTISLDIRIIAATNRNLEKMVREHQFREDLWFRLNVFPIWIPPLRERISDIPALLQHFITLKSKELKLSTIPTVSPGVTDMLMKYTWPGNVREMQNVVERALILNPSGPLDFNDINLPMKKKSNVIQDHVSETDNLDEITSHHIRRVLSKTGGKIHGPGGAAELLGLNASTLRNRMNKLGIKYKKIK